MKYSRLLFTAALVAVASCAHGDIFVQRNGIDGNFMWTPSNGSCFNGTPTTYLDISRPLSQSGQISSRTISYSLACDYGFGCSGPYFFGPSSNGSDVQLSTGSMWILTGNCTSGEIRANGPSGVSYGGYIGPSSTWVDGFTVQIVRAWNPVRFEGSGGVYWGVRVRLEDGWHYGWILAAQGPSNSSFAVNGYFRPGAYALEMTPDTPIRTPCRADINMDGIIDFNDYLDYVAFFAAGDFRARFNTDTVVDFFDYLDFLVLYAAGDC